MPLSSEALIRPGVRRIAPSSELVEERIDPAAKKVGFV
jgi:hypothetical protein